MIERSIHGLGSSDSSFWGCITSPVCSLPISVFLSSKSINWILSFEQTTNSLCFSSENQPKKHPQAKANEKLSTKTFSFFFAASILFFISVFPNTRPSALLFLISFLENPLDLSFSILYALIPDARSVVDAREFLLHVSVASPSSIVSLVLLQ